VCPESKDTSRVSW